MSQSMRGRNGGEQEHDDSLLQIIWRQKGLIALMVIIAVALAGAYVALAPKVYTAAGRIQVQRAIPVADRSGALTSDNNSETFVYQEAELIKSAPVLYTALGGPGMDELQIFEGVKN